VGLASSSLFLVLLLPLSGPLEALFVATPCLATIGGGAAFGWLVGRARRPRPRAWRAGALGVVLLLASFAGFLLAALAEPLGLRLGGDGLVLVFRAAFGAATVLVAGLCCLAAGWLYPLDGHARLVAAVALVAGATALLAGVLAEAGLGWRVGAGDRAMLRVAALQNLAAGLAGGALAFRLLVTRARP
jgi:hypothetical protein